MEFPRESFIIWIVNQKFHIFRKDMEILKSEHKNTKKLVEEGLFEHEIDRKEMLKEIKAHQKMLEKLTKEKVATVLFRK